MNGKEALQNIGIEFDTMGMICTNIGYEEFCAKDLHFNEIFKTEIDIIKQDLDQLEDLKRFKKRLLEDTNKLFNENQKLKQALEILKEYLTIKVFTNICGFYTLDACDYAIPYLDEEEYNLLKEVLK